MSDLLKAVSPDLVWQACLRKDSIMTIKINEVNQIEKDIKEINAIVDALVVNEYADLDLASVNDEIDTCFEKLAVYNAKATRNAKHAIKWSARLEAAEEVRTCFAKLDKFVKAAKEQGVVVESTGALDLAVEIATLAGIATGTTAKAVDGTKKAINEGVQMTKDVVRGTIGFAFGVVGDALGGLSAIARTTEDKMNKKEDNK